VKFTHLALSGVILIEPSFFFDARGYFLESYNRRIFSENGIADDFVQDNQSRSMKGVVRGLHYQKAPMAQAKLVRATAGSVWDVVVDIRPDSPTFGKWLAETLSVQNKKILYVPEGFAHGYCALEDESEVLYKVSRFYSPEHDAGILWNDPALGIAWPDAASVTLSEKDKNQPLLSSALGKALR